MNRIDRLTAMIIFLQGRQRVTVEEVAGRYDISQRTVYRDLRALQEAGVPIGSEPGEGYFIVKGYHLPPVMFDKEEAAALLAGERLMQKWSETALSESYLSALDKIRAVLRHEEKEYLDTLERHIRAFHYPDEKKITMDHQIFVFLQDAIFKREVIAMEYYSPYNEKKTQRDIEPLGLLIMGNHWYLAAWCRLRADYRMFRIDRIEEYRNTGNRLSDPLQHTLKEFYDQSLNKEKELHRAVVRFDREMIRYMGDQKYYHGWVSEEKVDGGVEMTFLCSSLEYFARWLLIWGDKIEIKEPSWVKTRVGELSEKLYWHHCGKDLSDFENLIGLNK